MTDYLTELFALQDKVAALTGAGGFLVSEMSCALAKAGIKVAVLDKDLEAAQKIANEIQSEGGQALAAAIDVTQKEAYQRCLRNRD